MQTYRYRGHSMSDPAKYRSKEEVEDMRQKHDPIETLKARMLEKKEASEDDFKKIEAEVRGLVNAAAEFAQTSPEPDPSELWTDVMVDA
jgi:pyruvate dehydrogenase E1 component alpha subunit